MALKQEIIKRYIDALGPEKFVAALNKEDLMAALHKEDHLAALSQEDHLAALRKEDVLQYFLAELGIDQLQQMILKISRNQTESH